MLVCNSSRKGCVCVFGPIVAGLQIKMYSVLQQPCVYQCTLYQCTFLFEINRAWYLYNACYSEFCMVLKCCMVINFQCLCMVLNIAWSRLKKLVHGTCNCLNSLFHWAGTGWCENSTRWKRYKQSTRHVCMGTV